MSMMIYIKDNAPQVIDILENKSLFRDLKTREVDGFKVPEFWSDNAARICKTRYANKQLNENSAISVCIRVANGWADAAVRFGYIEGKDHASFVALYAKMMVYQLAAPNSPQWFNTGVYLEGGRMKSSGNWAKSPEGTFFQPTDALEYPQVHACFINSVQDRLAGPNSIMDLWDRETKIFKHGSGSGVNISNIREKGAPLSGGGTSSGVMSFLTVGNYNAGAIKSGGTTRRAALMRTMDVDHPDIVDFIRWKRDEESKVAYLAEGSRIVTSAANGEETSISAEIKNRIQRMKDEGILEGQFQEMDTSWTSDAYRTVDGQNSNNSVMITDEFMNAVGNDLDWNLISRVDGSVSNVVKARDIWDEIAQSAWLCADPAVQFKDTINYANTAKNDGDIVGSNPCSEYLYLNDTACNLASINLANVYRISKEFDKDFACLLSQIAYMWTIILDITIDMASYPSLEIAQRTHRHRTLGLGFTGLGEYLAINGVAYESENARSIAKSMQSDIWIGALRASKDLARAMGCCDAYVNNKEHVQEVYGDKFSKCVGVPAITYNLPVRNMQLTNVAPTGTISFVMDAGSTGIEPVYALKTWKTLSEGGGMWIVAPFVRDALKAVGVDENAIETFIHSLVNDVPDFSLLGDKEQIARKVLATANTVSPKGHIDMMAEVQQYVCGAISKTINMPESASVQDIKDIYEYAYKKGVKCVSVYRDQSKLSQPMNEVKNESVSTGNESNRDDSVHVDFVHGKRKRLPSKRQGYTQKVSIDQQSMYIRTGEFENGQLGELFLDMGKEGGAYGGLLSAFAKAVSIGLQYGVPLEEFTSSFIGTRMQPAGFVFDHDEIKMCTSPIDLVFKDLELNYGRGQIVHRDGNAGSDTSNANNDDDRVVRQSRTSKEPCRNCGGTNTYATGTCSTCSDCGATTGCA